MSLPNFPLNLFQALGQTVRTQVLLFKFKPRHTRDYADTHVRGYTKRVLSDRWVPAQLWVITKYKDTTSYTIENTQGCTFMDIPSSTSMSCMHPSQIVVVNTFTDNKANGTPIVGYHETGNDSQHWTITLNSDKTAYM